MLVGHQPGIQDLALALVGAGAGLDRLSGKFPTAALATIAVPPPWSRLERGAGTVLDVVKPKQLPDRDSHRVEGRIEGNETTRSRTVRSPR
jgi:phosphohistidine phosphatase